MICPRCKEAILREIRKITKAELLGFSLTSNGPGINGIVRESHRTLYCEACRLEVGHLEA